MKKKFETDVMRCQHKWGSLKIGVLKLLVTNYADLIKIDQNSV